MNAIKFSLFHDGDPCGIFDTLEEAENAALKELGWTDEDICENKEYAKRHGDLFTDHNGNFSLHFVYELEISEAGDLIKIDGQPIDDYILDAYGDENFDEDKKNAITYFLQK